MRVLEFLASIVFLLCTGVLSTNVSVPTAPALEYMYTAFADCKAGIFTAQTAKGLRTAIPIVGGNFTGPRLNGKILNLGADWGLTDPQTGIFSADTRYNLQTEDGANIYIQTSGSIQPDKKLHLRLVFETGDKEYYWLNFVTAVGFLQPIVVYEDGSYTLRIDVWNLANEYKNTTFVNGTTY
ncbi:uncharacterized protein M421DRAFT_427065 [Didymella exigua CBS 183.55]|uniref:Uncharacterized protein n=1 Tax=Didymella exigua CBS 183.55 TaxID=1150837 RepID=A0A6A5R2L5_9PLEO|nr:uncharacterized protein M421DRAFT_427065 [Didymella exigua CBS 183.55]KAF1922291.1 hypothetical protein M421DRAFT_427065 [Didymella exigua CBS 183.55]